VTVVTNACAFYHTTRGCGRYRSARHSLRPLFRRKDFMATTRAQSARRECEGVSARHGRRQTQSVCARKPTGRNVGLETPRRAGCLKFESAAHSVSVPSPLVGVRGERSSLSRLGRGVSHKRRDRGFTPSPALPQRKSGLGDLRKITMRNRGKPRLRGGESRLPAWRALSTHLQII